MDSRQILKKSLKDCDWKFIADSMGISVESLNDQVAGEYPYQPKGNTMNFVDRLMLFIDATHAETCRHYLLQWMAEEHDCVLINNPLICAAACPTLSEMLETIQDFTEVVEEICKIPKNNKLSLKEVEKIRSAWERAKRTSEEFIFACETGIYDKKRINTSKDYADFFCKED